MAYSGVSLGHCSSMYSCDGHRDGIRAGVFVTAVAEFPPTLSETNPLQQLEVEQVRVGECWSGEGVCRMTERHLLKL